MKKLLSTMAHNKTKLFHTICVILFLSIIGGVTIQTIMYFNQYKNHFFFAYYPTWRSPYFNTFCDKTGNYYDYQAKKLVSCKTGSLLPDAVIKDSVFLAGGIPDYITHVAIAFGKLDSMHNYKGLSNVDGDLRILGLDFQASSASVKEAIRVLKTYNPGTKVLLVLGGPTYNSSWSNVTDADIDRTAQFLIDLGLDGLDVDYEVMGSSDDVINQYYDSILAMRKAVDKASLMDKSKRFSLSLAGWSTGADCTQQTQGPEHPGCANGKISYFGETAGRERLLFKKPGLAAMLDMVLVMGYDAGYEHYDPVTAYTSYKEIVNPGTPVALGIESAHDEPVAGPTKALVQDRGINNDCVGNTILQDQYGVKTPGTISVQRLAKFVRQNSGDGMMVWSLLATKPLAKMCGTTKLSTITDLAQGISYYLGIGSDRVKQIDKDSASNYSLKNIPR